ncbi:MAG TPA: hypothetical protein VM243_21155 [Phycisphaerae bacterium]|nr:hypothetical protein [Phycisphaerae bacterium]
MRTTILLACCCVVLLAPVGCVQLRAPDVQVNMGPGPEDVDSSRVPPTATHEEARIELTKAYRHIHYLEYQNTRLQEKYEKAREEREEYKDKYKRLKDKYDD